MHSQVWLAASVFAQLLVELKVQLAHGIGDYSMRCAIGPWHTPAIAWSGSPDPPPMALRSRVRSSMAGEQMSLMCPHARMLRAEVIGNWWRLSGESFVEDEDIRITTGVTQPFSLRVVTPNGQSRCGGVRCSGDAP